jgi:hypothetical protein
MRAKYCDMRYDNGIQFFNRLMSAINAPVGQQQPVGA